LLSPELAVGIRCSSSRPRMLLHISLSSFSTCGERSL
jgi:hypothetical protein